MTEGETESRQSTEKHFYCPEHRYNPPPGCGFAFCPQCEFPEEPAIDTVEAYHPQSPHWGSMVSPVAQIIRVKRCEHCGTAPAKIGPLCRMCEEDRKEKYGI